MVANFLKYDSICDKVCACSNNGNIMKMRKLGVIPVTTTLSNKAENDILDNSVNDEMHDTTYRTCGM